MTHGFPLIHKALSPNRIIIYFRNSMPMHTLYANCRIFGLSYYISLALHIHKAWHSISSSIWPEVDNNNYWLARIV